MEGNRGSEYAARLALEIAEASRRAALHPGLYAWVGSIHASLQALPHEWRRVLTRSRRHVLYYRLIQEGTQIEILAVRGAGQLPPSEADLLG